MWDKTTYQYGIEKNRKKHGNMIEGCDFKLVPGPGEQSPTLEMESPPVQIWYRTSVNHSDDATVLQGC